MPLTPYPAGGVAAEVNLVRCVRFRYCEATCVAVIAALVRMREVPFRTAGKEGQAFSVNRHWRRGSKKALPSLL
jgi:hypothetical protein